MDPQMIMNFATCQVSRLVMKVGTMAGVATSTLSQDKATQIAAAIVTLAAFGLELIQSHYAHGVTAAKAAAQATGALDPKTV